MSPKPDSARNIERRHQKRALDTGNGVGTTSRFLGIRNGMAIFENSDGKQHSLGCDTAVQRGLLGKCRLLPIYYQK